MPGLFLKEEYMAMTADLRNAFLKDRPGMEETQVGSCSTHTGRRSEEVQQADLVS